MAAEVVSLPVSPEREKSRAERRFARRRADFIGRMAEAQTPRERLDAAIDLFRATIADHSVNPDKATLATDHFTDTLIASADQLAKTVRRQR